VRFQGDELRDVHAYGSRGEQRLAVLWMKLAELSFIHEKTHDRPILLLDDIFSELDSAHRALVLSLIKNQQTVITSAEEDILEIVGKSECEVVRL
jgi:DNA replication and repair protein RecF